MYILVLCRSCGATLPDDARFCHECGRAVDDAGPRPRAVTGAAWLLIGSGGLSLLAAGLLGFLMTRGEVPLDDGMAPFIIGILLLNAALGTTQIIAGVGVRRRLRWAFLAGLGVSLATLTLAVADIAAVLFAGGGGTVTSGVLRVVLNGLAVRGLFESRSWFRQATSTTRSPGQPAD